MRSQIQFLKRWLALPNILFHLTALALTLTICLTQASAQSNDIKSIHQIESESHSCANLPEDTSPSGNRQIPLQERTSNALSKKVFGYHPYWAGTAYDSYNYELLSTVAYFSFEVDPETGGYRTVHYWLTTNLVNVAHAAGVKVVLVATNFGSKNNEAILSNPAKRKSLIKSLLSMVEQRNADGVNIDFENIPSSQRANLTKFMKKLKKAFRSAMPNSEVSMAIPAVDWSHAFDIAVLDQICDYFVLMGYDYHYSGSPNAGAVAPLSGETMNVAVSINTYLQAGLSPSKLLLGVPYYGYDWPTIDESRNSKTTRLGVAKSYIKIKTEGQNYERFWDSLTSSPWSRYNSEGWHQVWFDDRESLTLKYDLVNSMNLPGIGIWALSYDGADNELWEAIRAAFMTAR